MITVNCIIAPGVTVNVVSGVVVSVEPQYEVTVDLRGPPGLSAYQIAVANGFVGTEAQWAALFLGAASQTSLNAEIAARIAADLLKLDKAGGTMTGSLLATDAALDLGDGTHRWRDGYFSRNVVLGVGGSSTAGALQWATEAALWAGNLNNFTLNVGNPRSAKIPFAFTLNTATGAYRFEAKSTALIGWSSGDAAAGSLDTAFSRGAAGQACLGTGAAGDFTGTLKLSAITAGNWSIDADGSTLTFGSAVQNFAAIFERTTFIVGGNTSGTVVNPKLGFASTATGGAADTWLVRPSSGLLTLGTTNGGIEGVLQLKGIDAIGSVTGTVPGWGHGVFGLEMYTSGSRIGVRNGANYLMAFGSLAATALQLSQSSILGWCATTADGTADVAFSRNGAAGQVALGTGAQGNAGGHLILAALSLGSAGNKGLAQAGSEVYLYTANTNHGVGIGGDVVTVHAYTSAATELRMAGATAFISFTSDTSFATPTSGLALTKDGGLSRIGAAQLAVGNGARGNDDGQLWMAGLRLKPRTISALPTPTAGLAGLEMVVLDASAPAYGAAYVSPGVGTDVRGARCTGTDWRAC